MKTIDLIQGSPEWHAHRATHFNASDAPAMMGVSTYQTRTELLSRIKTGITADVDPSTQRRFDDGHRFEALARPLAEKIIGEELYPVTGSAGIYSASFDGLTLMGDVAFEHKTLNDDLREAFAEIDTMAPEYRDTAAAGRILPLMYRIQMEHQAMVSDCNNILFMASVWGANDNLIEAIHCDYRPDPKLRAQIVAGWEQLEKDLQTFEPSVVEVKPVGQAPSTLPALRIEITGMVTASNLHEFKATALTAIRSVNRELATDQDFADAEMSVKWCSEVEAKLAAAKEHALSQTASIDELFKAIDDISAEARTVRLALEKLVKARKDELRTEIVFKANKQLAEHIEALNEQFGDQLMPINDADFAGAIKNKRTIASLQDSVDTELARAKISASSAATRIAFNLKNLSPEWEFLFPDLKSVINKDYEDFKNLLAARVSEYKQIAAGHEQLRKEQEAAQASVEAIQKAASPLVAVETSTALLKLGDINARIAPLSITSEGLAKLGFATVATDKNAKLYREADFQRMCFAMAKHLTVLTMAESA